MSVLLAGGCIEWCGAGPGGEAVAVGEAGDVSDVGQDAGGHDGADPVEVDLLGVTPGPVVTERCAQEMADGVARLLAADVTVGVTGVGGPEPSEGSPPGTVIMPVTTRGKRDCRSFRFPGEPDQVIAATVDLAVSMLA